MGKRREGFLEVGRMKMGAEKGEGEVYGLAANNTTYTNILVCALVNRTDLYIDMETN